MRQANEMFVLMLQAKVVSWTFYPNLIPTRYSRDFSLHFISESCAFRAPRYTRLTDRAGCTLLCSVIPPRPQIQLLCVYSLIYLLRAATTRFNLRLLWRRTSSDDTQPRHALAHTPVRPSSDSWGGLSTSNLSPETSSGIERRPADRTIASSSCRRYGDSCEGRALRSGCQGRLGRG